MHEVTRRPLHGILLNWVFEVFLENMWRKTEVLLKSDKNNGLLKKKSPVVTEYEAKSSYCAGHCRREKFLPCFN
jgi:hypothetical protein